MQVETPSKQLEKLIEFGFPTPAGGFVGCTNSDIAELESHFSVHLPESYKDFLGVCGRDAGQLLDFCLYQPEGLISFVNRHLANEQNSNFTLPAGNFVFIEDNDILFYFDTRVGDDPPVWSYDSFENKNEQVFDSFSLWLNDVVTLAMSG